MKKLSGSILLLGLFLFFGFQHGKAQNALVDELEKKALAKLFKIVSSAKDGKDVELKAGEIRIGKAKIKVSATIEFDGKHEDSWIFAVAYETKLIGAKETVFNVGSVGIGTDAKDAEAISIDEWIGVFGTALAKMLAKPETGIELDNFTVFPGLMGIRGEKPAESWLDGSAKMNIKIINAALPVIKKSREEINLINLVITVDKTGSIDGECRINNRISQELLGEIKKLDWKTGAKGYMFKQLYLIAKRKNYYAAAKLRK